MAAAQRNVLSGNVQHGVNCYDENSNSNIVFGNLIGLSPRGDQSVPNRSHGSDWNFGCSYNQVGGAGTGERNVVSGNGRSGVEVSHGSNTIGNTIIGNFVGTAPSGRYAPTWSANGEFGIHVEDGASGTVVARNVVGNSGGGIRLAGGHSANNVVRSNYVGVSRSGERIPNRGYGIRLDHYIRKARVGPGNVVAWNPEGIELGADAGRGNRITRNRLYRNAGLGIDIEPVGMSQNDAGDRDTGPNDRLNFPVITRARTTVVRGTACAGCIVEVFVADGGAGAYGEGKAFVGAAQAGADGVFAVPVSGLVAGGYTTATATDASGNTSEFSRNAPVNR
jgi:hypothetical protein